MDSGREWNCWSLIPPAAGRGFPISSSHFPPTPPSFPKWPLLWVYFEFFHFFLCFSAVTCLYKGNVVFWVGYFSPQMVSYCTCFVFDFFFFFFNSTKHCRPSPIIPYFFNCCDLACWVTVAELLINPVAGHLACFWVCCVTNTAARPLCTCPLRTRGRVLQRRCQAHCFPKVTFLLYVSSLEHSSANTCLLVIGPIISATGLQEGYLLLFECLFNFVWSWLGGGRNNEPPTLCDGKADCRGGAVCHGCECVGIKLNKFLGIFSVLRASKEQYANVPNWFLYVLPLSIK